jgi:hypothetical protein
MALSIVIRPMPPSLPIAEDSAGAIFTSNESLACFMILSPVPLCGLAVKWITSDFPVGSNPLPGGTLAIPVLRIETGGARLK